MNRYWFKPKKFGYGASPSTWEGWALGVAYVVGVLVVSVKLLPINAEVAIANLVAWAVIVGAATAGLITIAYRKTDGPWYWRWAKRNAPRGS